MNKEVLKIYKDIIYADKVFDVNFKNVSKVLFKEIERLNNIINDLEKEISKHIALCTDITLNDVLDILQELKGSDKE